MDSSFSFCSPCFLDVSEDHFDIWGTWHSTLKSSCKDTGIAGQNFLRTFKSKANKGRNAFQALRSHSEISRTTHVARS